MDASSVLGITNAGIQAAGGVMINRDQRAIKRLQDQRRGKMYARADKGMEEQQTALNRAANYAGEDIKSDASERGVANSSIPQAEQGKLAYTHKQRFDTIQRHRNELREDKLSDDQIKEYADHAERLKRMFGMIDAAINGGAGGAANQYTGGTMNQGYGY